ncbi:hypothetical protein GCM10010919_25400 [Alishewanella longhuensis]|uniref:Uncharacterized protein n=1 Tax=Alishewanella longhuensis TaxID=1091037 RepID=A0ABQ3L177_9ALTE|nr:hypothetical protein [Alishewanella longhuensis]GHG72807.1 hypothetical protein GCM10010919_25400 [Alishewanella longhuensis]
MDMFLSLVTLFLVANMAIVFTLLRRIDLNNASVQAWEQAQVATDVASSQPVFNANLNTELVQ